MIVMLFVLVLLANAGITVAAVRADIDERAAEAPLKGSGATPEDVALVLAVAKAAEVSERRPGDEHGRQDGRIRP